MNFENFLELWKGAKNFENFRRACSKFVRFSKDRIFEVGIFQSTVFYFLKLFLYHYLFIWFLFLWLIAFFFWKLLLFSKINLFILLLLKGKAILFFEIFIVLLLLKGFKFWKIYTIKIRKCNSINKLTWIVRYIT